MNDYSRPPLPADEEGRLEALYASQLLDTLPEEVFDRLTRIVCASLNVPVSLISLIDKDRQWFKSSCGLQARETGRDVSFCGHAILSDEPFIVTDTNRDPRFASNPLVVGAPGIRFYAGVPIHSANHRIGTLCVIDTVPRELTAEEIRLLKSLARTVEDLLHLRQATIDSVDALNSWTITSAGSAGDPMQFLNDRLARDHLTGLPSRYAIDKAIHEALAQGTDGNASGLLALIDIDNLSAINERLGHVSGDRLIAAIGERLILASDPGDVAARIGGGLFAFLLRRQPDFQSGIARLGHIHEALNRLVIGDALTVPCSITTGYVPLARGSDDAAELLDTAHEAVRQAKALGHGLMCQYNRALSRLGHRALGHDLRSAAQRDEFFLVYQVKTCPGTMQPTGVEALLRWRHPALGIVPPADFIPIAEESGIIVEVGRWALVAACRQAYRWFSEGKAFSAVAVNLSPRQFLHGDIVGAVRSALIDSGLPASLLELELTESVAVCDVERAIAIMQELKGMGITLSIDDFGTGYSSLSYLLRLPVDKLKIDRAFIAGLRDDARSQAIVKGVIDICEGLGIDVIAEGVETADQVALLMKLGCQEMQGFYFGRPMTPAQLDQASAFSASEA
ncbi:putative bifunctional diguanylate cyclase/phosphodiesterase [Pseudoduganella umbonata]|uniref:Diguanylate cyclase (GGDEF)-like protein n=1 Tax=Pseudoduganella umbonata TaxID=864828 RepID=A0A4V1EDQ3_9BURK|nr:GGDEF domain-containing protein [Pseudoduganella umbonata]MBB3220621.1 diguanylate cyclase (GGDEF)-like protein [Pseudoduganella umbonata]QCP11881.1 sensor domain-containing phosphodiesterase [Pseudoduganella umbonata]